MAPHAGQLASDQSALDAGRAVAVAVLLLAARGPLHHLATRLLSGLAGLALLILLLQAAGHMALRWAGPGADLPLGALFRGIVCSWPACRWPAWEVQMPARKMHMPA